MINRCQDPCRLQIAGVRFAVSSEQALRLRIENPLYRSFISRPAMGREIQRIGMNVVLGPLPALKRMKKLFATGESWSIFRRENSLWIKLHPPGQASPFWTARFDSDATHVDFYREAPEPAPGEKSGEIVHPACYPLDQLLLMYFLARRRGILTHAAGIARGRRSFIFPGASGAGKSTFSRLLAEAKTGRLLSDERMIVREVDGTMRAFGTPWAGTAGIASNGSAPLAGIFFLKHGRKNQMKKLQVAEALERFLPLASIPWYDPDAMSPVIAFAKRLAAAVPAYEMSFRPDRSAVDLFWRSLKTAS